jgi:hypothetical protein
MYFCLMSYFYKTSSMFFAAVLFFLNICTQNYSLLPSLHLQNTQSENSVSYFPAEKTGLLFLTRQEERDVYSIKNLPVPIQKNHTNYINCNSLSLEGRILSINSGYLSYALIVDRSLANSDIVFPFHYFW